MNAFPPWRSQDHPATALLQRRPSSIACRAPRNAVTRTPRAASAPLGLPEGDQACAQVTTTPPVVRRWPGSAAGASCAPPPPPPPRRHLQCARRAGARPRGRRLPGPQQAPGPARPDQRPALHPARPARHRPRRAPSPTLGRDRLHPGRARRLRRPHRRAVPGRARRRRAPRHLRPRRHPAAVRRGRLAAPRSPTPHIVGNRYIVHPFFGSTSAPAGRSATRAVYRAFARDLNKAGALARRAGLEFGYHNHHCEFFRQTTAAPAPAIDILTAETDPRLVHLEVDLFWVDAGRADPVDLIQQQPRPDPAVPRQGHEPGRQLRRPRAAGCIDFAPDLPARPARPASSSTSSSATTPARPPRTPGRRAGHRRVGYDFLPTLRF